MRAYYSIAPTEVVREGLPRSAGGGHSRVPGYLLARLALAQDLQGRGLGSQLLLGAIEVMVTASQAAAGRLIVVDAVDEAAHRFYAHHGFVPIAGGNRLYLTAQVPPEGHSVGSRGSRIAASSVMP